MQSTCACKRGFTLPASRGSSSSPESVAAAHLTCFTRRALLLLVRFAHQQPIDLFLVPSCERRYFAHREGKTTTTMSGRVNWGSRANNLLRNVQPNTRGGRPRFDGFASSDEESFGDNSDEELVRGGLQVQYGLIEHYDVDATLEHSATLFVDCLLYTSPSPRDRG